MCKILVIFFSVVIGVVLMLFVMQLCVVFMGLSVCVVIVDIYCQFNLFGDVFEWVCFDYVEKFDDIKLIEFVISGMFIGFDLYLSYMDVKSFCDMQVQICGEFGGFGIEVMMEDGLIKVVLLIDDILVLCVGIMVNDIIINFDDEVVQGLILNQVVEKMCGLVNIKIKLKIICKGQDNLFDVMLVCDNICVCLVCVCIEQDDIVYICIIIFNEQIIEGLKCEVVNFFN